ncbi:uncharacterized protein RAG0_03535 [Rhynchosporium agropyri]|uniref:Uncharacterized protein n=1 Tax=Rhynchosporium agropyri TaxID=914238 RepID=A0A1E1K556_9HELO|nr:uncharacterized protein RAG0_03535 [Rhynchosporium agropyri]
MRLVKEEGLRRGKEINLRNSSPSSDSTGHSISFFSFSEFLAAINASRKAFFSANSFFFASLFAWTSGSTALKVAVVLQEKEEERREEGEEEGEEGKEEEEEEGEGGDSGDAVVRRGTPVPLLQVVPVHGTGTDAGRQPTPDHLIQKY